MNKLLLRLSTSTLVALLIAPAFSQDAPPVKTKEREAKSDPAKFELRASLTTTPELIQATKRLELAQQRLRTGLVSSEEVSELSYQRQAIERRAPVLFTLRSLGGPLSALVDATSSVGRYSDTLSFTLINAGEPADLETQLPPFTLNNANWGTIIGVLGSFLASRGLDLRFVGGDSPNPAEARSVVCVLRRTENSPDAKHPPQPAFESFQLADYINPQQSIEAIVDAIRTAWELDPAHDAKALRLKFHPATKILLVSGPAPATGIAKQVVGGLRKNPVQR
jgi:hypothetical protein